eukprot:scaffold103582_cov18-Tisochrysis_lutea.AAC.2
MGLREHTCTCALSPCFVHQTALRVWSQLLEREMKQLPSAVLDHQLTWSQCLRENRNCPARCVQD